MVVRSMRWSVWTPGQTIALPPENNWESVRKSLEELPSLEVRKSWKSFWSNLSLCLKPVSRLGVFPWNIPEMTSASFGPQVTMPMSKHMVNLKMSKHMVWSQAEIFPCSRFLWLFFKSSLIPGRHTQAHAGTRRTLIQFLAKCWRLQPYRFRSQIIERRTADNGVAWTHDPASIEWIIII